MISSPYSYIDIDIATAKRPITRYVWGEYWISVRTPIDFVPMRVWMQFRVAVVGIMLLHISAAIFSNMGLFVVFRTIFDFTGFHEKLIFI